MMPMTTPIINLQGVSVRYRLPKERIRTLKEYVIKSLRRRVEYEDLWALKNVHLQVWPGEMLGIIGRNGAGKSTLLKLVAKVMKPTAGSVTVQGKVVPLIELGTGFDLELTGRENIYLNGSILGRNRREMAAKYDRIVAFSELAEFLESPVRAYSSGMVARLGFAIATEVDPTILILDEILGIGDLGFQRKCLARIKTFRAMGTTILFVSHSLEQVRTWCDRCLWLERGEVQACGETAEVTARYEEFILSRPQPVPPTAPSVVKLV